MSEFPAPPPPAAAGRRATGGPSGPRAGFWQRFGAALVDGILLGIVGGVLRSSIDQV